MIGVVLCRVLVACNCLKTMTTYELSNALIIIVLYVNLHTEFNLPVTRPHHLLNCGSKKKIGPRTIKLAYVYVSITTTKRHKGSIVRSTKLK